MLKRHVRTPLAACVLAASSLLCTTASFAQPYPNKVVHVQVSDAGSNVDLVARVVAQGLSTNLGRQFVVDNRPGVVAIENVIKAPPDGYNILFYTTAVWTMPLMQDVSFDTMRDLAPVTLATNAPLFLFIHPSVPAKNMRELIALAKASPGTLNYGMAGTGTSGHLATELLRLMTGIDIVKVPYKGSSAATIALLANQVQMQFTSVTTGMAHVATGKLRLIAVASGQRSTLAPDVPTIAESGVPGYEVTSITAMWVPVATPKNLITKLNQETVKILKQPDVQEKFVSYATESIGSTPEQAATYVTADIIKWRKVVKDAHIRVE